MLGYSQAAPETPIRNKRRDEWMEGTFARESHDSSDPPRPFGVLQLFIHLVKILPLFTNLFRHTPFC